MSREVGFDERHPVLPKKHQSRNRSDFFLRRTPGGSFVRTDDGRIRVCGHFQRIFSEPVRAAAHRLQAASAVCGELPSGTVSFSDLCGGAFCRSFDGGRNPVLFWNDLGDADQRLDRQAWTEGSADLCGGSDTADLLLSAGVRLGDTLAFPARNQPEEIFSARGRRPFLSDLRYRNGGLSESPDPAADSAENVRKKIEIKAVPGYTVSMFIVLRGKEWTRRYNILLPI